MTQYATVKTADIDPGVCGVGGEQSFGNCLRLWKRWSLEFIKRHKPAPKSEAREVQPPSPLGNQKEKTQSPERVIEFFWLRRWDFSLPCPVA